ncbi:hypothetical protein NLG97_g503 [Lecanicillium saksenae]|uniref:Uncharacterized protein n=1 Tax=Lecanicillium saksenae TaxID=468837 RepID=A0ACC1R6K3_9HYPO|nr:hypothetical protein NLG97_g503 [Lecanicillium saksenae]
MDELSQPLVKRRKHMRKGTRSCTECRRRKIRCIFVPGKAICVHCELRGCQCIDQRDARTEATHLCRDGVQSNANTSTSDRSGYRTKVVVGTTRSKPEFSDVANSLQDASVNPPIVSAMGSATPIPQFDSSATMPSVSLIDSYRESARKSLLAILPDQEEIISVLTTNRQWWDSFQRKLGVISFTDGLESLEAFAVRVINSGQVTELATLAVGYERSLDDDYSRLPVIERLIFSSFDLLCTVKGLECLILLAKTYTDIGKPKRAWLTWRKGLAAAQLLGLHRLRYDTPAMYQRIWWAIYHGDRFTSLLLGLPHGCNDSMLTKASHRFPGMDKAVHWISDLVFDTCIIAGQAIDNNAASDQPSFATAMKLDEQMNSIAASAPCNWWLMDRDVSLQEHEVDQFLDGLIIQFFFLHVRMYLHLPFITTTTPAEQLLVSSKLCFTISERMLQCYTVLRFTAAVVLLVSRRWRAAYHLISPEELASSLALLGEAEAVFQRLYNSTSCNVAGQCCSSLRQLLYSTSSERVAVPYFGVAVLSFVGDTPTEAGPKTPVSSTMGLETARKVDFDFAPTHLQTLLFSESHEQSDGVGMDGGLSDMEALDWDLDTDWSIFFD